MVYALTVDMQMGDKRRWVELRRIDAMEMRQDLK